MDMKQTFILSEKDVKEAIVNHVKTHFPYISDKSHSVFLKTEPVYGYGDLRIGETISAELTVE